MGAAISIGVVAEMEGPPEPDYEAQVAIAQDHEYFADQLVDGKRREPVHMVGQGCHRHDLVVPVGEGWVR